MTRERTSRIVIKDLPKNQKVSREEMRMVMGGIDTIPLPEFAGSGRGWPRYLSIGTWPTPEIARYGYFARGTKRRKDFED